MVERGLVSSRSQAENFIKLGQVTVNGKVEKRPSTNITNIYQIKLITKHQYVSRAAYKLESVVGHFGIDFRDKTVLDVGSSTGGFTDFALQHGANKVIAVDVGTDQLHPNLRSNPNIELNEQTDIRDFKTKQAIDIVVIDVSFISLREILPSVARLVSNNSQILAMVKPQFEAFRANLKHKGVIKNEKIRREILKDFEIWIKQNFIIQDKADSKIPGNKGNIERFFLLKKV